MMLRNLREYHRPRTLADALALLRRPSPRTWPLGGGSALVGTGGPAVEAVVDLRTLGLDYVRAAGDHVRVGSMATLQSLVEAGDLVGEALARAARQSAGRTIRNAATLGGTLASEDCRSPVLTVLNALDAQVTLHTAAKHQVGLTDFFERREQLLGDERGLITEVAFRATAATAYEQVGRTPQDYPIVCAAAAIRPDPHGGWALRAAFGGVSVSLLHRETRQSTAGGVGLDQAALEAALHFLSEEALQPPDDHLGSAAYRRSVAQVLGRRVLLAAWQQAMAAAA